MSLVEQQLVTLPGHLNTSPIFRRACVAQSLNFTVVFYSLLFVFCHFTVWQLYRLSFDLSLLITSLESFLKSNNKLPFFYFHEPTLSVHVEGYSRKVSYAINSISMFLFKLSCHDLISDVGSHIIDYYIYICFVTLLHKNWKRALK